MDSASDPKVSSAQHMEQKLVTRIESRTWIIIIIIIIIYNQEYDHRGKGDDLLIKP